MYGMKNNAPPRESGLLSDEALNGVSGGNRALLTLASEVVTVATGVVAVAGAVVTLVKNAGKYTSDQHMGN